MRHRIPGRRHLKFAAGVVVTLVELDGTITLAAGLSLAMLGDKLHKLVDRVDARMNPEAFARGEGHQWRNTF